MEVEQDQKVVPRNLQVKEAGAVDLADRAGAVNQEEAQHLLELAGGVATDPRGTSGESDRRRLKRGKRPFRSPTQPNASRQSDGL